MNDDILPLVISHIRSTAALLRLRATCRAALRELSVERVMGMPLERIRLFARPCSESIGVAKQTARPEDIGASFTDQGESFWTWGNTASGRVCINRYERQKGGEAWKQLGMYEASNPSATFLWLHVAEAGVISMLSAADNSLPIIFTAFRCEQRRPLFHCEIDKRLLLDDDASPPAYRFNKRNLLFASWAGRSFLAILPVSRQASSVGLMRIEADGGEWRWWDVSVTRDDEQTLLPIRAMCQVDSCIYVMPGLGGALFALDLAADAPHPRPVDTLPLLDAEVSMIQVLPDQERHHVLAYSTKERALFHLETGGAPPRRILSQELSAFLFVNATSALAFFQHSCAFLILNLATGDVARRCSLDHVPACVALHADALWSVGVDMLVHRVKISARV